MHCIHRIEVSTDRITGLVETTETIPEVHNKDNDCKYFKKGFFSKMPEESMYRL